MNSNRSASRSLSRALALLAFASPALANDWVIPAGQTVVYDTAGGPVFVENLIIETGAKLRVVGNAGFRLTASRRILVDGVLDLSGFDNPGVLTLNTSDLPEPGSPGGAGGGQGGYGNAWPGASPSGADGSGMAALAGIGGRGGESSLNPAVSDELRRGAGGGGGTFAADQPVHADPLHVSNVGLIARRGQDGAAAAIGAISGVAPAQGGGVQPTAFTDANDRNDFYGRKLVLGGHVIQGELAGPGAGAGGGAGGNAIPSAVFPDPNWSSVGEEKGAGGGGGGGLGILVAQRIDVGAQGRVLANGGRGGGGENSFASGGITRIGGGSGGGSGGHLILQARVIDLRRAPANALSAIGGRGGPGKNNVFNAEGAGGDGGPGVVQLHPVLGEAGLLLAPGVALESRSSPDAHVLLPEPAF